MASRPMKEPSALLLVGQVGIGPAEHLGLAGGQAEIEAVDLGGNRLRLIARALVDGLSRYFHPSLGWLAHVGDDKPQSVAELGHQAARIVGRFSCLAHVVECEALDRAREPAHLVAVGDTLFRNIFEREFARLLGSRRYRFLAAAAHLDFADIAALDSEIDGGEPIRPARRQPHVAAREPGLRGALEADEGTADRTAHRAVAVAGHEISELACGRAQDDFGAGIRLARIGETEIAVARRIAGARFLEGQLDAAGHEVAHRLGLDRIARFAGHEAGVPTFDRKRFGTLADGKSGDLVRLVRQTRKHALAASVGGHRRRAGTQHGGGGTDAQQCEHRQDGELPRVHELAPRSDFTGTARRGRRSANPRTKTATVTGTTPTLSAVIQLLRLSTSRRSANCTSRSSERTRSSWVRNPSIAFSCSGLSTSPAPSPVLASAFGTCESFCSVSLSS